jgi:hypothetical protein
MCLCTSLYTSPICESRLLESTYTLFNRLNGINKPFSDVTKYYKEQEKHLQKLEAKVELFKQQLSATTTQNLFEEEKRKPNLNTEIVAQIAEKLGAKKPKFEAKPWMLAVGWRLDWLSAIFFNTKRRLSKYSTRSLLSSDTISNAKIKNALNFEFQRIESVIAEVVRLHQK